MRFKKREQWLVFTSIILAAHISPLLYKPKVSFRCLGPLVLSFLAPFVYSSVGIVFFSFKK
ncbi:unnamed protein product [Brassica rapa subsp. trilocularis]